MMLRCASAGVARTRREEGPSQTEPSGSMKFIVWPPKQPRTAEVAVRTAAVSVVA